MHILVTGSNQGLGLACLKVFLQAGHHVLACTMVINEDIKSLEKAYPQHLSVFEMDVSCDNSIARACEEILARYKKLDCIINNAGVLTGRNVKIADIDIKEVRDCFDINVFGAMLVTQKLLSLLLHSDNGSILNISSEAAILAAPHYNYSYCMSKTALTMFTQCLDTELGMNIRCYAIHPGRMRTGMAKLPGMPPDAYEKRTLLPETTAEGLLRIIAGEVRPEHKTRFIDYLGNPME